MTDILCPTCKDDDCIDSYRVDSCTACGWSQYVPLESDRFQAKKECPENGTHRHCLIHEYCHDCDLMIGRHVRPVPSPPPEREKQLQCVGCGWFGPPSLHKCPSDAVEAKIKEMSQFTWIGRNGPEDLRKALRELVKRVREGA